MTQQPITAKAPRSVAFAFALLVTLGTLGGIDALAAREHASHELMAAQPAAVHAAAKAAPCTSC